MRKRVLLATQRQVLLPLLGRPTDKPVPVLALPGRRSEHQASQGATLTIADNILQVLSHRPAKTQIMKAGQRRFDPGP